MQFFSTRDTNRKVTSSEAIAQGLSDEGGLFVPESFPQVDVRALCELDYPALAAAVIREYLTDYSPEFLAQAARTTYGEAFGGKAGYLAPVEGDTYALELWHGPTCAFKDYALQLMPRLLVEAKKNLGRTEKTLILVATSGDTGKAALDGYHDIPGVEIAVFYPTGGTSEIQRLQMATQEGANVAVYAVRGNFDDAQTGVKKVFGDKAIAAELEQRGIRLSSANSINWGRLVPQIVYYFAAYAQLLKAGKIAFGDAVDFCVPTGNFGDILAGYYAKRMGLPVGKLVCASNENNVLTDFLTTGTYTAKREFFKTTSPSMDILVSSNLERLLYHVTGSDAEVAGLMKSLAENGSYTVRPETLAAIQETFACGWSSEKEVAGEIRARYEQDGYLCDTHTAVAFHVAAQKKRSGVPMVVLSTASPFKFPRSVLEALGRTAPENDFEAMQQLEAATGHAAPASLALFVLGDPHLSLGASKPMDIFPGWNDYVERLEKNWRKLIQPEDTIVLAGDISWAMRLTDTRRDFAFLQSLPGQKIIMKGNHDYWWSTANKMNAYLKAEGFDTLHILHNNSYSVEGYAICGTRGWLFDVGEPHDEKVMNREIGRLRMSLDAAEPGLEKLVFLHYPPVYTGISAPEIVATLKEYGIRTCYYGHLHGNAIRYAVQGEVDGIRYKLVSADGLRFCPYRIN